MRQKIRRCILLLSFLAMPVTLIFMSPYLSIRAGSEGIVAGCLILFALQLLGSFLLGRVFCGWLCPGGAFAEMCFSINDKPARGGWGNWIKYFMWGPWVLAIGYAFWQAGGVKRIDPLYMWGHVLTPPLFGVYFAILLLTFLIVVIFGRRASCHYFCHMAPFMVIGRKLANAAILPGLGLKASADKCVECRMCDRVCPMSLSVCKMVKQGEMENSECILCGECVDACRKNAIKFSFSSTTDKSAVSQSESVK